MTELAAPFEMSMPAVSKHLRVLERAGLVERGREAQFRPCRLRAGPLEEAAGWLEQYRRFWEESFERLDEYLQRLQAAPAPTAGPAPGSKARPGKASEARARKVVSGKTVSETSVGPKARTKAAGTLNHSRATEKRKEKRNGTRSKGNA